MLDRKVLVADDDRLIREAMSAIMATDDRYQVMTAADGEAAQQIALLEIPDLIFLDLHLPKVDGWEVCRFLKMSSATVHIKLVIISGATQDLILKTVQFAPDAILVKPFRAQQILDVLGNLLD